MQLALDIPQPSSETQETLAQRSTAGWVAMPKASGAAPPPAGEGRGGARPGSPPHTHPPAGARGRRSRAGGRSRGRCQAPDTWSGLGSAGGSQPHAALGHPRPGEGLEGARGARPGSSTRSAVLRVKNNNPQKRLVCFLCVFGFFFFRNAFQQETY